MRVILHSDLNSCYASIESVAHPEYRSIPMAVGGEQELRHGIILAKNELAKKCGVKTGEAIWQAKSKCPSLLVLPPNYPLYQEYCGRAREIYETYTDLVEPFGPDECWLDVTGSTTLFGDGAEIAELIRNRVKSELGITVSVGVSWNKVFAKFGSDYKKPDAVTLITPRNYKEIVWNSPASDLLFVGYSTANRLRNSGIYTIGDIARCGIKTMRNMLGKNGETLFLFASGLDMSPVTRTDAEEVIKSIGNSTTPPRDIVSENDVRLILNVLADSVARRLREHSFVCRVVQLYIRDTQLYSFERQMKLTRPTGTAYEIFTAAMTLYLENRLNRPLRSLGVRACELIPASVPVQTSMFINEEKLLKKEKLEITADRIRERYGKQSICRAIVLSDPVLGVADKPRQAPEPFAHI